MKIIVGLGNPGLSHYRNRHNFGFMVIQALAKQREMKFGRGSFRALQARGCVGKEEVILIKPMTYMNLSGQAVARLTQKKGCALDDLLVVCDDFNLDLGRVRLRRTGSAGGHNGLQSIIDELGSENFPRLRLGIGRPPEGVNTMKYVLGNFRRNEWPIVHDTTERAVQAIETWVYYGIDETMNRFN